ncbi:MULTISPECIES: DUF397 domain-containing protein [Streptomyces]|uniref:DUF397 domain-containing protein n=1 Tax=Streptomyces TaxID=1883 RepID=UPI00352EB358
MSSTRNSVWVKSSYSGTGGDNCVGWAPSVAATSRIVPVRDSKDTSLPGVSVSAGLVGVCRQPRGRRVGCCGKRWRCRQGRRRGPGRRGVSRRRGEQLKRRARTWRSWFGVRESARWWVNRRGRHSRSGCGRSRRWGRSRGGCLSR